MLMQFLRCLFHKFINLGKLSTITGTVMEEYENKLIIYLFVTYQLIANSNW